MEAQKLPGLSRTDQRPRGMSQGALMQTTEDAEQGGREGPGLEGQARRSGDGGSFFLTVCVVSGDDNRKTSSWARSPGGKAA